MFSIFLHQEGFAKVRCGFSIDSPLERISSSSPSIISSSWPSAVTVTGLLSVPEAHGSPQKLPQIHTPHPSPGLCRHSAVAVHSRCRGGGDGSDWIYHRILETVHPLWQRASKSRSWADPGHWAFSPPSWETGRFTKALLLRSKS